MFTYTLHLKKKKKRKEKCKLWLFNSSSDFSWDSRTLTHQRDFHLNLEIYLFVSFSPRLSTRLPLRSWWRKALLPRPLSVFPGGSCFLLCRLPAKKFCQWHLWAKDWAFLAGIIISNTTQLAPFRKLFFLASPMTTEEEGNWGLGTFSSTVWPNSQWLLWCADH